MMRFLESTQSPTPYRSPHAGRGKGRGLFNLLNMAVLAVSLTAVHAEESWRNKTVSIVVGSAPGGSYDLYARLVARHLGRFLPGAPSPSTYSMISSGVGE